MNVYLDTSTVLRVLLKQDASSNLWGKWNDAYVSELVRVEFFRTVDRLRLLGKMNDDQRSISAKEFKVFWESCYHISVNTQIVERASGSFPTVIKTLDAIHLSTALEVKSSVEPDLLLLTHDRQLKSAAIASGLDVEE